jgi:hypothetical protein
MEAGKARKMKVSKSKTFHEGADYGELIEWVMHQITTIDYQPEGTASYHDGLAPYDPVCELDAKYIITITRVSSSHQAKARDLINENK